MNLNHQIKPVQPTLNVWRKLNEVIDALNWIMSMYGDVSTDGNSQLQIVPGARGPVFRMNVQSGNQQPWATDPDGNPTGWLRSIVVDPDYNDNTSPQYGRFDESWMWSGPVQANPLIPWFSDPDTPTNEAGWVTVNGGTNAGGGYYWGTGQIVTTNLNFKSTVFNQPSAPRPIIVSTYPKVPFTAIPPSSFSPVLYLAASDDLSVARGTRPSIAAVWAYTGVGPTTPGSFNWTYTVGYGYYSSAPAGSPLPPFTQIAALFSLSGSAVAAAAGTAFYLPIDPTGWAYDPGGIAGYEKGAGSWIYQYAGPPVNNLNPGVQGTFTASDPNVSPVNSFLVTFYAP